MPTICSSDCPGYVSPGQALLAQLGFPAGEVPAWGRGDAVMAVKGLKALPVKVGLLDANPSSRNLQTRVENCCLRSLLTGIRKIPHKHMDDRPVSYQGGVCIQMDVHI